MTTSSKNSHLVANFKSFEKALKNQLRPLLQPRRFQAYCLGTAKSGTHSMAAIFRPHYRAIHEPENQSLIRMVLAAEKGIDHQEKLVQYVRNRDRNLWLELDSSQVNYFLLDVLLSEFPKAKFILTIRDCYSWLDSFTNHQLSRRCSPDWQKLRELRFGHGKFEYAEEEQILLQNGLYTLDGYLSYWATHNREVLAKVPQDRLLVIKTKDISQQLGEIADFLSIRPQTLNVDSSHSFKARKHFNILSEIDQEFLSKKVNQHCQSIMDQFFPNL